MISESDLSLMQEELVWHSCRAHIMNEGTYVTMQSRILDIQLKNSSNTCLLFKFSSDSEEQEAPIITLHYPFTLVREKAENTIAYKFYRGKKMILLIGYWTNG
jgi:hypothetical protein